MLEADTRYAGDSETLTAVSAAKGAASLGSDGTARYTAPAAGADTISFTYTDQLGETASVAVEPGPTAGPASTQAKLGQTLDLTTLLLGASSAGLRSDALTLTGDGTTGTVGSVSLNNGVLTHTASDTAFPNIPRTVRRWTASPTRSRISTGMPRPRR